MEEKRVIICLFGATGDLAARKLYPAFFRLFQKGFLKQHFAVIGAARREWTDDYFRQVVKDSIASLPAKHGQVEDFASHFYYHAHDVTDANQYDDLKAIMSQLHDDYQTQGNQIFYISLAPKLFPVISSQLKNQGLLTSQGYNRLIIEKPFGYSEKTACDLQKQLTQAFNEDQIYRIDHYLGKSIVNQILPIRFNNYISQLLFAPQQIDHIQITLDETLGVEGRGAYYEASGVSRDMIQNHALQLLSLICLAQPEDLSYQALHQSKLQIFQSLQLYEDLTELHQNVVRGQYSKAHDGSQIAYRDEVDVAKDSLTETFLALKLQLQLDLWSQTPIYIRSGKQLNNKQTDIKLVYKPILKEIPANYLQFELAPQPGIRLCLSQSDSTYHQEIKELNLSYRVPKEIARIIPDDYEKLIFDCMNGDLTNFAHFEELRAAWRFIDRIHQLWQKETSPSLVFYPAGSNGPEKATRLIEQDGRYWINT